MCRQTVLFVGSVGPQGPLSSFQLPCKCLMDTRGLLMSVPTAGGNTHRRVVKATSDIGEHWQTWCSRRLPGSRRVTQVIRGAPGVSASGASWPSGSRPASWPECLPPAGAKVDSGRPMRRRVGIQPYSGLSPGPAGWSPGVPGPGGRVSTGRLSRSP